MTTRVANRGSLVAQLVKNLPAMQEIWVRSLGQEDPLEKGMATHSSTLAWRILWTEDLVDYSPWNRKKSASRWLRGKESTCQAGDAADTGSISGSARSSGGGNGNPLVCILVWEIPRTEEPGWLQFMGLQRDTTEGLNGHHMVAIGEWTVERQEWRKRQVE